MTDPGSTIRISAIVSTYNSARFLRGCLDDLLQQTILDEMEIVVVDSGSDEGEGELVTEYTSRFDRMVYLRTEEREGLYRAWNRAIKASSGTYLTSANTDDRHREDCLEILVNSLDQNPGVGVAFGWQYVTETENETFATHTRTGAYEWPKYDREVLLERCCVGPQPVWRRQLHERIGLFDEGFTVAGDWDFWLRASQVVDLMQVPEYLGLYLKAPGGIEWRNQEILQEEITRIRARYSNDERVLTNSKG